MDLDTFDTATQETRSTAETKIIAIKALIQVGHQGKQVILGTYLKRLSLLFSLPPTDYGDIALYSITRFCDHLAELWPEALPVKINFGEAVDMSFDKQDVRDLVALADIRTLSEATTLRRNQTLKDPKHRETALKYAKIYAFLLTLEPTQDPSALQEAQRELEDRQLQTLFH